MKSLHQYKFLFALMGFVITVAYFLNKNEANAIRNPSSNPTLDDLFNGTAIFQNIQQSQEIHLNFTTKIINGIYDQKIPIFFNDDDGFWYTITRGELPEKKMNVFLFKSKDAVHFEQVGDPIFDRFKNNMTIYDAHIAKDESVHPANYIMTIECAVVSGQKNQYGASVCISETTKPWISGSWSDPQLIIKNDGNKSGSTGVVLVDSGKYYLTWTMVDDVSYPNNVGTESTSSWAVELTDLKSYKGLSTQAGQLLIGAHQNTHCKNSWDCNNVDIQDWKKINNSYYAIYNGANYYRCVRGGHDSASSDWALAIRKSETPMGNYDLSSGILIASERKETCGISYPMLNQINGEWYMYYAYYPQSGIGSNQNKIMRSKLIFGTGKKSEIAPMPQTPNFEMQPYPSKKNCNLNQISELPSNAKNKVTYVYCLILNREPDSDGLILHTKELASGRLQLKKMIQIFFNSPEFENMYQVKKLTNRQFVFLIYGQLLQRSPDGAGLKNYLSQLSNGSIDRADLLNIFLETDEFKNSHAILK